jgi:DNA polymerase sigma
MIIMTSLDPDTSSGDCFMGILSSENFLMAFSFLATKKHFIRRCDPFDSFVKQTKLGEKI